MKITDPDRFHIGGDDKVGTLLGNEGRKQKPIKKRDPGNPGIWQGLLTEKKRRRRQRKKKTIAQPFSGREDPKEIASKKRADQAPGPLRKGPPQPFVYQIRDHLST